MTMERTRLAIAAVWLFAGLYIATDLNLSWRTGPILFALGLVPPIALFWLWNHAEPALGKRAADPRAS
jgi:hypothetical protein